MSRRPQPKLTVAVIGAGFGGLAAAIKLNRFLDNDGVTLVVFEAQLQGAVGTVYGNLSLPHGEESLRSLGMSNSWEALSESAAAHGKMIESNNSVPQEDLRRALLQVAADWIRPSERILGVEREEKNGRLRCVIDEGGLEIKTSDEFDIIIAADGVMSRFRSISSGEKVALVGDSRWCQDRFDFGLTRISCGADVAIRDGIEVAKLIFDAVQENNIRHLDFGKFCANRKCREIRKRRTLTYEVIAIAVGLRIASLEEYRRHVLTIMESVTGTSMVLLVSFYICGKVRVPLPRSISPIPVTLHTLIACWGGMALGSSAAVIGATLHAILWTAVNLEGARGMSNSGKGVGKITPFHRAMPSLGYVYGLIPCALVAGNLQLNPVLVAIVGQTCTLATGIAWLAVSKDNDHCTAALLRTGALPFLPGLLFKSIIAWRLLLIYKEVGKTIVAYH